MILIGGGSRSGKSSAALRISRCLGPRIGFIATAQAFDAEMQERIDRHRADRSENIITWEEPFNVAERIANEDGQYDAIVVDCLTLWLTNYMLAERPNLSTACEGLIETASRATSTIVLVTNEVGCGIVPEYELGRRFRDEAGRLNQLAAEHASEVHWMIFGIGLRLK